MNKLRLVGKCSRKERRKKSVAYILKKNERAPTVA